MIEVEDLGKAIKWGKSKAVFQKGAFKELSFVPLIEEIKADPEGFYAFAGAIVDELEAHKPEPEKKPRKPRSDRGVSKKHGYLGGKVMPPSSISKELQDEFIRDPEKFMREHPDIDTSKPLAIGSDLDTLLEKTEVKTPNLQELTTAESLILHERLNSELQIHGPPLGKVRTTDLVEESKSPKLDIHGPDGADVFIASFKDKKESGFVLPNVVKNLKAAFGGKWPDDMSAEDKTMGNDLIAGKKPE